MASPRPASASDDGSAHMVVDDDEESEAEEAEERQLGGGGQEQEEQEAEETDEASVPSQVLEDEDSNGSSLAAARTSTSKQAEVLEQLDHLQDVRLVFLAGGVWEAVFSIFFFLAFFPHQHIHSPPPSFPFLITHKQQRLLDAVRVASEAIRHLSTPENLDEESVQKAYDSYLEIMQEVHEGLASRAAWIKHYVPYHRHTGELRQEVRVLEMRVGWLKSEAKRLGYPEGGWKQEGEEGVEEEERERRS